MLRVRTFYVLEIIFQTYLPVTIGKLAGKEYDRLLAAASTAGHRSWSNGYGKLAHVP